MSLAVSHGANAQVPDAARTAFNEGKFVLAASLAEAEGSAEGFAFAARAHIADAITREDGLCLECLIQAEATAQAAIKSDTDLAEGYIQLAIAIGFRGRVIGLAEARSGGLPEKGRAAIDRALELDPGSSWAQATLGAWHLEIVHRAGPVLAAVLYGAREDEGLRSFQRALAANPNVLLLHFHFALSILALDPDRFGNDALEALQAGFKDPSADALTTFTRQRTMTLIELLKSSSHDAVSPLVRQYQGHRHD